MLITSRDKPIGRAKCSALSFFGHKSRRRADLIREAAQAYGVHPQSIYQWMRRHPDCQWSFERIARQVAANKDQSQVAKRQGFTMKNGRHSFGRMTV